jgi:hypothetical protein
MRWRWCMVAVTLTLLPRHTQAQQGWRSDRSCRSALSPSRFRVLLWSPDSSPQCAQLPNGVRVCRSVSLDAFMVTVEGPGLVAHQLAPAPRSYPFQEREVIDADLDGDGQREVVIAALDGVSNGMGVPYWTVYVLTPSAGSWHVDSIEVHEYSTPGSWVISPHSDRCTLLVTRWANGEEPGRGGGLYLYASWWDVRSGRLSRREAHPMVRRRYLLSFQNERWRDSPLHPLSWLQHPAARIVGPADTVGLGLPPN